MAEQKKKPVTARDIFDDIADSNPTQRDPKINLGVYELICKQTLISGYTGSFVFRFEVASAKPLEGQQEPVSTVGSTVGFAYDCKSNKYNTGTVKLILASLLGAPLEEITRDDVMEAFDPEKQPLTGKRLLCNAFLSDKKNDKGEPYRNYKFSALPE